MLPNLTCVLICSLKKCVLEDGFKDSCSKNFVTFAEKYPCITGFTVKEVTVSRAAISLKEALNQIDFLEFMKYSI